jgi:predicted dehydrogenase
VDVATPNDSHREIALEMLEAGKHVACEKPLAGTLNDARAMRDAAKKHRKKLSTFVWFNYRRCPAVALAWQMMRQGLVGRVYHVRAQYLQSWGGPETPLLWRFKKGEAGSGAHGDLNAHIVDMARFLLGEEVQDIHGAVSRTFVQERVIPGTQKKGRSDVDDAVVFLASFQSGAIATFEATRLASGHLNANRIEINGELGALRFDFESMNELWYCDNREDVRTRGWKRIVATSTAGKHPYAANWWPDAHVVGYEHGFTNMAADVVASLCGQEPLVPLPDFEDAYQTQRVLEAALVSAKEKASIRMAEVK